MFRLHYFVTSTLLFILSIVTINGNNVDFEFEDSDFSKVLPLKSDLVIYLKSLRRILFFCSKHKYDLDMNFEFGLFLTSVNLKKALLNHKVHIPKIERSYIMLLLKENNDLIDFFENMVKQNNDPREMSNKMIITLFSNETQWLKQLRRFDSVLLKESKMSNRRLKEMSSSWHEYMKSVDDMDSWIPQPRLSDKCMVSLASNDIHDSIYSKCQVYAPCYDMLTNGTDFGYALSHRLLFLLQARHGRGCSIFSKHQDQDMTKKFCTTAFDEANFIAMNDYKVVDLFLEQMSLCAMAGYAQFLQRSWLSNILRFQTPYGCFGQRPTQATTATSILPRHPRSWKLAKNRDHRIMDGVCDGHVTSVAAGTLAAAIRYILEMYY